MKKKAATNNDQITTTEPEDFLSSITRLLSGSRNLIWWQGDELQRHDHAKVDENRGKDQYCYLQKVPPTLAKVHRID